MKNDNSNFAVNELYQSGDAVIKSEHIEDVYKAAPIPQRLKKNAKVIIITGDNVEDLEFFYPYYRFNEEGYEVDVVTEDGGEFEGKCDLGLKNSKSIKEVNPQDYELIYLPGGKAPKSLRKNEDVINFVKQFAATGKPIASICHGAQILISARLVGGKKIAAWPEMKEELEEAGAQFSDEALNKDGQFITARMPGDLHRHLCGVIESLETQSANN